VDLKKSLTRRLSFLMISLVFCCFEACLKKLKMVLGKKTRGTCVVLCYHSVPWDRVKRFKHQMAILDRTAKSLPADFQGELQNGIRHAIVTFDDGYNSVIENALPVLKMYRIEATLFVSAARMGVYPDWISIPDHPDLNELTMSREVMKSIPRDLIRFGSHGLTHASLTDVDEQVAEAEIVESKEILEKVINAPIRMLAFPYGFFNRRLVETARRAGYSRVFTVEPVLALATSDEFCSGRFEVCLDYWDIEFKLILLGAYRWLPAASRLKKRLLSRMRTDAHMMS